MKTPEKDPSNYLAEVDASSLDTRTMDVILEEAGVLRRGERVAVVLRRLFDPRSITDVDEAAELLLCRGSGLLNLAPILPRVDSHTPPRLLPKTVSTLCEALYQLNNSFGILPGYVLGYNHELFAGTLPPHLDTEDDKHGMTIRATYEGERPAEILLAGSYEPISTLELQDTWTLSPRVAFIERAGDVTLSWGFPSRLYRRPGNPHWNMPGGKSIALEPQMSVDVGGAEHDILQATKRLWANS